VDDALAPDGVGARLSDKLLLDNIAEALRTVLFLDVRGTDAGEHTGNTGWHFAKIGLDPAIHIMRMG
jgi:hypothetical protein